MNTSKKSHSKSKTFIIVAFSCLILSLISFFNLFQINIEVRAQSFLYDWIKDILYLSSQQPVKSLKLGTFYFPTPTITPIPSITTVPARVTQRPKVIPNGTGGKSYCIDDEGSVPGNEPCDDASKFDIQKGVGGVTGTCGTVIQWAQTIMEAIQQGTNRLWSQMNGTFTSCGYTTAPSTSYLSTYVVIDSYNLAGFHELTKANHTSAIDMQNWFRSPVAQAAGYRFIPYNGGSIQPILSSISPGQVMFLGSHVGIVNSIEVNTNGNGWVSLLHSNTSYWLGVIIVDQWNVINTPSNFPLTGFGGH